MKCQLTYLPFGTPNVISEVDEVLDLIADYNVDYQIGDLSTLVEGDREEIFKLIEEIYRTQDDQGKHFRFHVELLCSNIYS